MISLLASQTQDDLQLFLKAVLDGWTPGCGGQESKEVHQCLSWVGRGSAARLIKDMVKKKDPVTKSGTTNYIMTLP